MTLSVSSSSTSNSAASSPIVMSGMRPTGRLHLGHYMGVLANWVRLQENHACYFMIADLHALTTKAHQTQDMVQHVRDMALDWLAAGIEPERSVMYVQSHVPEISELHLLLSMLTPSKWVETDPTLKEMVEMSHEDLTYGLLGYPVLQTSDILTMRGNFVPVGKDQLAHLEISRDLARRFNHVYQTELFLEPRPLLTEVPILKGLDGRKMGKSYGNAIDLADDAEMTAKKIRTAITDPARIKRDMPGNPDACEVVFDYYSIFAPQDAVSKARIECETAVRGCVDCKRELADHVNAQLAPLRERRKELAGDTDQVDRLLKEGAERARSQATETLRLARKAMKLYV